MNFKTLNTWVKKACGNSALRKKETKRLFARQSPCGKLESSLYWDIPFSTWGQFHQHSMGSCYASSLTPIFLAHSIERNSWEYFLAMCTSKGGRILLAKLNDVYWPQRMTTSIFGLCAISLVTFSPGLNFINIQRPAFTAVVLRQSYWHTV